MAAHDDAANWISAAVGHEFERPDLLAEALTHPSAAAHGDVRTYERLEFLGDRVLGLVIAERLFVKFPDDNEGDLAKRLATLVSGETLVQVAMSFGLADHLTMPAGETAAGTHKRPAILADACEALIGALYLDGGLDAARAFIESKWEPLIQDRPPEEPKTQLQEWVQARGMPLPRYETVKEDGPSHEPVFTVELSIEGVDPVRATGRSKRAAEQEAARLLVGTLETDSEPDIKPGPDSGSEE